MIENWLILAVIAGLSSNVYNILNRIILRKEGSDPTAFGWITEASRLLVGLAIIPFNFSILFTTKSILLFTALSTIELISVFLFMKMHAYSHLSVSTIIQRTRLIWIPIIAFVFLGERLFGIQYVGIVILFIGLSITTSPKKLTLDKGLKYAYTSSVVTAILHVVLKESGEFASSAVTVVIMSLLSTVALPFVMKSGLSRISREIRTDLHLKVLPGIANASSMFFYVLALQNGPISIITSIYQGMMVVSVAAGIIFLKERENIIQKIIGTAVTLLGVLLLI